MEWTEERRRDGMDQGRDREGRNGPRKGSGRRGDGMDRGKRKAEERSNWAIREKSDQERVSKGTEQC